MLALTHGLPRGNPYPSSLLGPQLNVFPFGNLIGRGEEKWKQGALTSCLRSDPVVSLGSPFTRISFSFVAVVGRLSEREKRYLKDLPCLVFSPPPIKPYRPGQPGGAAGPDEEVHHMFHGTFFFFFAKVRSEWSIRFSRCPLVVSLSLSARRS